MKVLLSYSTSHFQPGLKSNAQKFWGSSASVLASNIYAVLCQIGDVTYIDASEGATFSCHSFDLFVGIERNFEAIVKNNHIKKSILFAVNSHPQVRSQRLLKYLITNLLSFKSISRTDIQYTSSQLDSIEKADGIILLGDTEVLNTYISRGVKQQKIRLIDYEPLQKTLKLHKSRGKKKFLYVASEIGLRKGFDIIYSVFTDELLINTDFELNVVGTPSNIHYANKLRHLEEFLGSKMKYHGWLRADSKKYHEVINKCHYVVFPSLEEGQAGSVVDSIRYGLIPILTKFTGVNYSPLGVLETKTKSVHNVDIIQSALFLSDREVSRYRNETTKYFESFHKGFQTKFKKIVLALNSANVYPLVSITLSIHNKEKTIRGLLELLLSAVRKYGNIEIHIIFDGCSDKSVKLTRNVFSNFPNIKVKYYTTPDVFEIKSNNLGLKKSVGKYCVILQDDNYVYDENFIFEAVNLLERSSKIAILGGLAGVNFYPRGTTNLKGKGQIAITEDEVYWRQDQNTNKRFQSSYFQVDACMRGPLFIRNDFLKKHGYLDEIYAPLYQDDMDLCFRAKSLNYQVFCVLLDVINHSLTMGNYDEKKWTYFTKIMKRNTDIFYDRWHPSLHKHQMVLLRANSSKPIYKQLSINITKTVNHRSEIGKSMIGIIQKIIK